MKTADRVRETTLSGGVGVITLGGAQIGFRTFASAFADGDGVWYCIDDAAGNWEVGRGAYNAGVLTRTTVLASSNANALVNFGAGNVKSVFATIPGELFQNVTGNVLFSSNNAFDVGDAAATGKPRTGYFGTSVVAPAVSIGDGSAANPALRFISTPGTGLSTGIHGTSLSISVNGSEVAWFNSAQLILPNGSAAQPSVSFSGDGGTGIYLDVSDVLGIAAGIIKVAKFRVQAQTDDTASGDLLTLFSGGGGCYAKTKHYTQTAIAAVAKRIHVMDEFACWILVSGNDGTNFFMDELMGIFGSVPVVKNSLVQGAPAARTYSLTGSSDVKLVMAAGTYAVNTFSLQVKAR